MVSNKTSRNIVKGLTSLVMTLSPFFSLGCESRTLPQKNSAYAVQLPVLQARYQDSTSNPKTCTYRTENFEKDSDEVLLARMIFGEARNSSYLEKVAVGYTAVTRARDGKKWNGETIKEVILKHSKKGVHQYSCFNRSDPGRKRMQDPEKYSPKAFDECLRAARDVLEGKVADPTGGATHYYSPEGMRAIRIQKIEKKYKIQKLEKKKASKKVIARVKQQYQTELKKTKTEEPAPPYWAKSMHRIGKIDVGTGQLSDHVFYKP